MSMNPEARRQLATTIRALRERLLRDLHDETESTYRLSLRPQDAGLTERPRARRHILETWICDQRGDGAADQSDKADKTSRSGKTGKPAGRGKGAKTAAVGGAPAGDADAGAAQAAAPATAASPGRRASRPARSAEELRRDAEGQAAYTLLNRLIILRLLEARRERSQCVVTGGWESQGYKNFRQLAPALVRGDETEGYAYLLELLFQDLAQELPGVFGRAGVADLIPVSAGTLRHVIERLDDPALASCWTDDMTLGWVYQYWNDPQREALDAKINGGGRIEPHEIASKTQMFTERYMVDWLLQNSLGPLWLALCKRHGWTPEVEADGTLQQLEERRVAWRCRRDAGEVPLTELMPLEDDSERRWAYYVPQSLPEDAVAAAPTSVRDLKILDPAVGSGHFLVVAFDLLLALYREEARQRGAADAAEWSERRCVERILEHNLHGIDLDPRAVQIAAAALWLKAQAVCPGARPRTLNLVASSLGLGNLRDNDPALVELRRAVERETSIPADLTDTIVHALQGADHLGSLLKVDAAVAEAIAKHEEAGARRAAPQQQALFGGTAAPTQISLAPTEARRTVLERLETFLGAHTAADDLGLRLRGEQLAQGVRFVRMVREGGYDLVVGNPPYQGTARLADASYVQREYPRGKADLYAAFLERGLQLVREGGTSALLTMRNWMFIKQYEGLRTWLLTNSTLRLVGDLSSGAFEEISPAQVVVSVVMSIMDARAPGSELSVALRLFRDDTVTDIGETDRKRAAVQAQAGRYEFLPASLHIVQGWPLVYWWNEGERKEYEENPKLGDAFDIRKGLITGNDVRFNRYAWEVRLQGIFVSRSEVESTDHTKSWAPTVKGNKGRVWVEPLIELVRWLLDGLEVKVLHEFHHGSFSKRVQSQSKYFRLGVAFAMIGDGFSARAHRFRSVFGNMGSSVFPHSLSQTLCVMNRARSREILSSLNPGVHFEVGDVNRLPITPVKGSEEIYALIEASIAEHESGREPSVEFCKPTSSCWAYSQVWAQASVDRHPSIPLPAYDPRYVPPEPSKIVSFALGVALGRFGADGQGILDPATADLSDALPAGLLFLDGTLDELDRGDGLGHPAAAPIHAAWAQHGAAIDPGGDLRTWLRLRFFPDVHKTMYEGRPVHWPLSSERRTFVAWINIHRWTPQTLTVLLSDHLQPLLTRLEGSLADLRAARDGADKKAAKAAEKGVDRVLKARDELSAFLLLVQACADRGPPPPDNKCPPRQVDARYAPDLDDGVMINSAALWPLLDPQWKDPKRWWQELCAAKGKKDYDWAHLARRYWPARVDLKCQADPSLAVAHGCFWRYHPARAYAWELRLQDEIAPDFRLSEAPYDGDQGDAPYRAAFLRDHPKEALAVVEREALRRLKPRKGKPPADELHLRDDGLWTALPAACWALELKLSGRRYREFFLRAPDEPQARAAFHAQNPDLVARRQRFIAELVPPPELFASPDEPDEPMSDDDDDSDPDTEEQDP